MVPVSRDVTTEIFLLKGNDEARMLNILAIITGQHIGEDRVEQTEWNYCIVK